MEHPLVGDLNHLTQEQLGDKLSELNKKLGMAMATGNGHLCNQLRMAIASYTAKYQEKLRDSYASSQSFADKINIK
jgi:hypothetical protein